MTRPLELDDLYAVSLPSDPQLSPDGERVAFVLTGADREADEDRSSIWLVPAGGGESERLTSGTSDLAPRWSPDGMTLAFLSTRGEEGSKSQIHLLPVGGGEAHAITELPLGAGEPVWSPDGDRVAFAAVVDLDPDGGAAKPVATDRLDHKADGIGLLKDLRTHLFVVPASGAEPPQLTTGDFHVTQPVWSPDGSRLAYSASTTEDRDLEPAQAVYVVPAEGGEPERITPEDGAFAVVDWSRDGRTLLLAGRHRADVGHTKLFTVPASGGQPTELLPGYDRNVMVGAPAYPGAL
ncbi:MAG: TolB family protein, partial [Actinomycetota bacterium]